MGCGCPTDPVSNGLICAACPDRLGESCTLARGSIPLVALTIAGACPRGKHVDGLGIARVAGIRWYGAPAPLRWATRSILTRAFILGGLGADVRAKPAGCGCIVRFKDAITGWRTARPRRDRTPSARS